MNRRECIRVVFLHRAESYGLSEVAHLTETSARSLRKEVASGYRDAAKVRGSWRFTWQQLALIAFDRWSLAEIHEALGADAAGVLPPLLALRSVTVCLPEYLVRALESVAAVAGTTIDDALSRELVELASGLLDDMEVIHPGFRHAYFYPGRDKTTDVTGFVRN